MSHLKEDMRVINHALGKDGSQKLTNAHLDHLVNPLRPNSDLSQTSHCNIKVLSVSEVMRIENMITQVKFY